MSLGVRDDWDDQEPSQSAAEMEAAHPPLERGSPPAVGVSEGDRVEYNAKLAEFHGRYREYLDEEQRYRAWQASAALLELEVTNTGGAPADDLDISAGFPEPVTVHESSYRPPLPAFPSAPKRSVADSM